MASGPHHAPLGRRAGSRIHQLPPIIDLGCWIGVTTNLIFQLWGVVPVYHPHRLPPQNASGSWSGRDEL